VEPFGDNPGASSLRTELVRLLAKNSSADFVIAGTGETFIKGYLATNPRVRYLNSDARPVYGGYLSLELKNSDHETVWSYLVTPRRFGPANINHDLASQMVRKLTEEIQAQRKARHP
jgi:hypothetical protein